MPLAPALKLRTRLALRFTAVAVLLLAGFFVGIYFYFGHFSRREFEDRLALEAQVHAMYWIDRLPQRLVDSVPIQQNEGPEPGDYSIQEDQLVVVSAQTSRVVYAEPRRHTQAPNWFSRLPTPDEPLLHWADDHLRMAQLLHHPTGQYVVYISGVDTYGAVQVRQLRNLLILSWLGSIFVLFGLGWWFARKALVPVSRIVQQAQHIGVNNLQLRVPERTPRTLPGDELDQLARTFNDMLARLGVSFELQRRFVQNASHELNTPLTSIMGEIELALTRERPVAEYQQTLQSVYEEAERLSGITHALLTMARIEEHPLENTSEPIALAALVTEQVAYYRAHFPERTLEWLPPAGSDAWRIVASEALLRTAIRNVLDNALKYSQQAVQVQLERSPGTLRLRVQDRGIGIPTAEQQRILQPLYRASNAAGQVPGSGLGLSLVQRILELHGGELHLASEQGHGTTVELVWPDRS